MKVVYFRRRSNGNVYLIFRVENDLVTTSVSTIQKSNQDKILAILFFVSGIIWLFMEENFDYMGIIIAFELICFALISNKKIVLCKFYFAIVSTILLLVIHFLINGLYELAGFSYNQWHSIYSLSITFRALIRIIITPLPLYVFLVCFIKYSQDAFLIRMFAWGGLVSLMGFIFYVWSVYGLAGAMRERLDLSFLGAVALARSMVGYLYCFIIASCHSRRFSIKVVFFCGIVTAFFILLLTLSRASTFSFLIGVIGAYILSRKLKYVYVILLLSIVCYFSLNFNYSSFIPERFTLSSMMEKRFSYRLDVWNDYLSHATLKDYLLGTGYNVRVVQSILYQKPLTERMGLTQDKLYVFYNRNPEELTASQQVYHPHNTYLFILLSIGVTGLLFYLFLLLFLWKGTLHGIKQGGIHWIYLSILITFILRTVFEIDLKTKSLLLIALVLSQTINYIYIELGGNVRWGKTSL